MTAWAGQGRCGAGGVVPAAAALAAALLAGAAPAAADPITAAFAHDGAGWRLTLDTISVDVPVRQPDRRELRAYMAFARVSLDRAAPPLADTPADEAAALAAVTAWCRSAGGPGLLAPGGPLLPAPQAWFEADGFRIVGLSGLPQGAGG